MVVQQDGDLEVSEMGDCSARQGNPVLQASLRARVPVERDKRRMGNVNEVGIFLEAEIRGDQSGEKQLVAV